MVLKLPHTNLALLKCLVGDIYGLTNDVREADILQEIVSSHTVLRLRRMNSTYPGAIKFSPGTLPDAVYLHKVHLHVVKSKQCKLQCGRPGHVAAAGRISDFCSNCEQQHHKTRSLNNFQCINCGKDHLSTSRQRPKWQEDKAVVQF